MMILHSKASSDGGGGSFHSRNPGYGHGGGGSTVKKPSSAQKLYRSAYCFYVYPNGKIEVAKNRWEGIIGMADIEDIIPIFSKVIADLRLKDTNLDMFKEGLSELLQEAITNTLKGDYHERTICAASAGNGS